MDHTPESISRLIGELQGDDEFTRAQAAFMLGMLGDPAVTPLIRLLSSPSREVRMRASWALGVIGGPALAPLLELAQGDDQALRVEAIRVLGVVGEARALNQLFAALADPDAQIAARAARALGKVGDARAYHPLLTALRHPNADVRYEACRSLADLRVPEAVTALRELAAIDESRTTWGASVADAAERAAAEAQGAAANPSTYEEFARISALLKEHYREG
jgi:HEAT repeat protein